MTNSAWALFFYLFKLDLICGRYNQVIDKHNLNLLIHNAPYW